MTYGNFIEAQGHFAHQIGFLKRAISTDHTRFNMTFLRVEASDKEEGQFKGVATDARRMHIVDPLAHLPGLGLEAGNWQVLRTTAKTA
jgi:hypothetical protein